MTRSRALMVMVICLGLLGCTPPPSPSPPRTKPQGEHGVVTPQPDQMGVSGVVLDHDTGEVIADAVVRVQATAIHTMTDIEGRFVLGGVNTPVTLTAFAPGYYILDSRVESTGEVVTFELHRYSATDNPDYEWLSAEFCAECHAADDTVAQGVTLPYDQWLKDAHSQSAENIRFLTMYSGSDVDGNQSPLTRYVTNRDYGRVPLPPDDSVAYYGPGYKLDFPQSAGNCATCHLPAAAINDPYGTDPRSVSGVEAEGVTCDFCHKVSDVTLDEESHLPNPNMPGILSMTTLRPSGEHQLFIGPFDDVAPGEDTFSPLQHESAYCSTCHFGIFWDVQIYNSYGEWLDSPYSDPEVGQTCQDCHMPVSGAVHFALYEAGGLHRNPNTIPGHTMPGALDADLLANTLDVDVEAIRDNREIQLTVTVTNSGAGHHVPTDSPLRQVFVIVSAIDQPTETLTLIDGPTLPAWAGDLAGEPGVYFAKILEELWTEVSPTGAYWNPTQIVEDTRLAAFESRSSTYVFAASDSESATIQVEVLFRRAYYDLATQKGWNDPDIMMEQVRVEIP